MKYSWAVNPQKLTRAITKAGVGASESDIKALYISYGGKTHDTIINTEDNQSVEEERPLPPGPKRTGLRRSK